MNSNRVKEALKAIKGKFFYVEFEKNDGSLRGMFGRMGVKKHTNGRGLNYNPEDHDLVIVWDSQIGEYRSFHRNKVKYLKCGQIVLQEEETQLELTYPDNQTEADRRHLGAVSQ